MEERKMHLTGVIGFFVVMLVIAPTLQVGAALAAAKPSGGSALARPGGSPGHVSPSLSLGKQNVAQMALGALGAGAASTKHAARFGGGAGHFAVNGTGTGGLTRSFVQRLRRKAGALPASSPAHGVVQVGEISRIGAHMLELTRPSASKLNAGSRMLYSTAVESFLREVTVPQLAWLQLRSPQGHLTLHRATSLQRLHRGMLVLVSGDVVAGTLRARVVSTLAGAKVHRPSIGTVNLGQTVISPHAGMDADTTGNFGGTAQLPTYSWSKDFNNTLIFTIGIVEIKLQLVTFTISLGGQSYQWPFKFTATPRSPLVVGQPATLDLQVTPQSRSNGAPTLTFTAGVDAGIGLYIWIALGCGTFGLSSCRYSPKPHVGFGMSLSTNSPAPMPGTSVKLNQTTCPTLPIFAIPVVNWGLVAKACLAITLKGDSFNAFINTTGTDTRSFPEIKFDGKTPRSITFTPTASQVNVTFGFLNYATNWDIGIEPIIALNPFGVKFSFGSLTLASNQSRQWIGFPTLQAIQLIRPDNQPDSIVFPFTASSQSSGSSTSPSTVPMVR